MARASSLYYFRLSPILLIYDISMSFNFFFELSCGRTSLSSLARALHYAILFSKLFFLLNNFFSFIFSFIRLFRTSFHLRVIKLKNIDNEVKSRKVYERERGRETESCGLHTAKGQSERAINVTQVFL